ncbi:hypothetical protein [Burkholderia orbicola]|uniref:hypothetical protein n=1 Tax=Burkholderia orbicola TaxID=2978683 RepID=UPI002FE13A40
MFYRAMFCVAVAMVLAGCNGKSDRVAPAGASQQAPTEADRQAAMNAYIAGSTKAHVRTVQEIEAEDKAKK